MNENFFFELQLYFILFRCTSDPMNPPSIQRASSERHPTIPSANNPIPASYKPKKASKSNRRRQLLTYHHCRNCDIVFRHNVKASHKKCTLDSSILFCLIDKRYLNLTGKPKNSPDIKKFLKEHENCTVKMTEKKINLNNKTNLLFVEKLFSKARDAGELSQLCENSRIQNKQRRNRLSLKKTQCKSNSFIDLSSSDSSDEDDFKTPHVPIVKCPAPKRPTSDQDDFKQICVPIVKCPSPNPPISCTYPRPLPDDFNVDIDASMESRLCVSDNKVCVDDCTVITESSPAEPVDSIHEISQCSERSVVESVVEIGRAHV